MILTRRRTLARAAAVAAVARTAAPARAVIILDITWRAEGGGRGRESAGFRAHVALANQPQFAAVMALSSDEGEHWGAASGTWIAMPKGKATFPVDERPPYHSIPGKAAAENKVDEVMAAVRLPPGGADAGNWLSVTLRRESEGASRLDGILGSGDSGGSAWVAAGGGWAIAGVNANGNGNTYGSQSYFARVSGVHDWLTQTVPGLRFVS